MKKILSFFAATLIGLVSFAQTTEVTYTVDKYSNELPSNAAKVLLNIYPVNFGDGVEVEFVGDKLTDVTITDSENNNLGIGSVSPVTDVNHTSGCEFQVDFNNAIIADAIAAAMQQKIGYMLSFKEGSLQYNNAGTLYTNRYPVTAYLYFWDAVDFFASATAPVNVPTKSNPSVSNSTELPLICDHATSVSVYVKAQGHWGLETDNETYNPYTVAIATGAKATITGEKQPSGAVNTTATISKGTAADEFVLTFDDPMFQVKAGSKYTVTIPEGAFTASYSESEEFVMTLDVCAHPVFTVENPVDMDPNNVFTMPISVAADHADETIDVAMNAESTACTVDGVDATFVYTPVTATTGTITVTTATKLAAGTHNIVFPAGTFKANLCPSLELTATINVEDVVWTYNPSVIHINDATTEFDVTVGATFQGTALDIHDQTIVASLDNGTTVNMTYVSTDADLVNTYHVVMPTNITFVAGKDDANPTEHLNISASSFKADDSENAIAAMPIVVVEYVKYSIDTEEILIDNEATEFTFSVYTKNGSNVDLVREITSNVGQEVAIDPADWDPAIHVAFNGGFGTQVPVIVPAGDNKLTAKFPNGSLNPGNYQLNIPVNALWADANANDNKMFVNFRVMNHIDITLDPEHECVGSGVTTATVQLKGWDAVDNMDATINVNVDDETKITIDGQAITSCVATANAGEYVITFPAALAEGVHKLVFAPKAVKANASYNAELTYTINVEDFEAEDVTIAYGTTTFDVKVSDAKVEVIDATAGIVTFAGTTITGTLSNSTVDGYVTVTTSDALPANLTAFGATTYAMTIPADAIKGVYATHNSEELTCDVNVEKVLEFIDNSDMAANGNKFTKPSEIDALPSVYLDKVNYTRNFTGKMQPFAVPFEFTLTDELSQSLEFYRVVTIAEGYQDINGATTVSSALYIDPVKVGEKVRCGRPYIVKSNAAGDFEYTFEEVRIFSDWRTADIAFTSTQKSYTSTINLTDAVYNCNTLTGGWNTAFRLSGGAMKRYADMNINIYTWRWGIVSKEDVPVLYMPMVVGDSVVDEDGMTTGIKFSSSDEESTGIYNLNGQKLNKVVKGVNIVNGKKVVIK